MSDLRKYNFEETLKAAQGYCPSLEIRLWDGHYEAYIGGILNNSYVGPDPHGACISFLIGFLSGYKVCQEKFASQLN